MCFLMTLMHSQFLKLLVKSLNMCTQTIHQTCIEIPVFHVHPYGWFSKIHHIFKMPEWLFLLEIDLMKPHIKCRLKILVELFMVRDRIISFDLCKEYFKQDDNWCMQVNEWSINALHGHWWMPWALMNDKWFSTLPQPVQCSFLRSNSIKLVSSVDAITRKGNHDNWST